METASTVLSGNEGTRELDVLSCIIEDVGSVVRLESTDPDPDPLLSLLEGSSIIISEGHENSSTAFFFLLRFEADLGVSLGNEISELV